MVMMMIQVIVVIVIAVRAVMMMVMMPPTVMVMVITAVIWAGSPRMSAMGLGCVKTRRYSIAIEELVRLRPF